jgi:two-component system cell cycle sensor histidine kinase/response regulator CckA
VSTRTPYRILVVDDNVAIHADFRKILMPKDPGMSDMSEAEAALFGDEMPAEVAETNYEVDSATQGEEGLHLVRKSLQEKRPYALAFVDVRMPPGWDGIETIGQIWKVDPTLQVVICTAYSDYSWEEMVSKLGRSANLLILKKPFDSVAVHQLACAMTEKWSLSRQQKTSMAGLESLVGQQTDQLQKLLSLTQATLDATADGILVIDKNGKMAGFNQKFLGIWNLPPSLIDSKPYGDMVNAVLWQLQDPEAFLKRFQELSEKPDAESFDIVEFNDGRVFERLSQPQKLGAEIVGRVWSFRDITNHREAERKIVEQAGLLDLAQDAIFVCDMGNRITFWNKGSHSLFGWTTEEVAGRAVSEFLYVDREAFQKAQLELLQAGEWNGEMEQLNQAGETIVMSSRWTLVRGDSGEPKSILAINTDVTERKKMEARFLRTQRMQSIGILASGVAHDLNNILSPIMMSVPLLRMGLPPEDSEQLIHNVEISAQRGAEIVKQLLAFGRGVEGDKAVVQLRHLVKEISQIVEETFPKDITIKSDVAADLWPIIGDSTQMHQVLLNLCINARDAMPDGGSITLAAENLSIDENYAQMDTEAKVGPYVVLRATDTGTGIPAAVRDKIFDPFFTTKEQGKGTGLGLSTVMGIARSHGGFINVNSEAGKGTTFNIHIPSAPDAEYDETIRQVKIPKGEGETILLVDDEETVLHATSKLLEMNGYKTLPSANGVEALATFAQQKSWIAAVVTDVMMPVMDGAAMMRVLKRLDPGVKVLATSGLEQDSRFEEMQKMGISGFLAKPYTAEKLLCLLREAIDGPPPGEVVESQAADSGDV